ncbi:MAG: type II secretion system protein [Desulfotignum sp.]
MSTGHLRKQECSFGRHKAGDSGVTLIEMIAVVAIISILAAGIMPLSQVVSKRTKELELRKNLRVIRTALDEHKKLVDEGIIPANADSTGYPENLEALVTGVNLKNAAGSRKKFLRRIPKDPMTEDGKWGLRSYADDPDSTIWGGQDVYDVYSLSTKKAIDGSFYKDW